MIDAGGRVTPHTGVWIETDAFRKCPSADFWSRPTRACGLKRITIEAKDAKEAVTPHTGVWIETPRTAKKTPRTKGHAPHGRVD